MFDKRITKLITMMPYVKRVKCISIGVKEYKQFLIIALKCIAYTLV